MSTGKNMLLVVVSIFLVLALVFSSVLLTTHIFLYPDVYMKTLEKSGVYNFINNSTSQIPGGEFIEIPNGSIKSLTDGLLENTLSYFRGDSKELNLTLDVNKNKLKSFFESKVSQIQTCNNGQNPFNGSEVVCKPAGKSLSEFTDEVLAKKNITISETGKVDLKKVYGLKDDDLERLKSFVHIYQLALYGFIVLCLVLLGLIFFISKDTKIALRWTGIDLAIAGLISVAVSYLTINFMPNINIDLEIVKNMISDLTSTIISREQLYGFSLLGIGIVVFGVSFFVKNKKK